MSKEILINADAQEKRVAIVEDGQLLEFHIERPQDKTIVGNIYKGRIEAVMPSIGAAFVDIGLVKKLVRKFLPERTPSFFIKNMLKVLKIFIINTETKQYFWRDSFQL